MFKATITLLKSTFIATNYIAEYTSKFIEFVSGKIQEIRDKRDSNTITNNIKENDKFNAIMTKLYTMTAITLLLITSKWFKTALLIAAILDVSYLVAKSAKIIIDSYNKCTN